MFRLADDTTSRKVIQVANKEGTQSFAMLHTLPIYRPDAPSDPEVRFMETASGQPVAVRAWWQQGERTGYEFLYSKAELAALNREAAAEPKVSARIGEPAIEAEAEAGEPVAEGPISGPDVIDGPGVPAEEQVAQLPASQQAPAAQGVRQEAREETREAMPQTASPLALLLLGGLVSTSVGLRLLRKS